MMRSSQLSVGGSSQTGGASGLFRGQYFIGPDSGQRKSRSDKATWSQAFANLVAVLVSSKLTTRRQCSVAGGHLDVQESGG